MSAAPAEKYNPFEGIETDEGLDDRMPAVINQAAETLGFVRREMQEVAVKRQRGGKGSIHQFTARVRVRDSNKFVLWCERHRLTYWEAFAMLVEKLDEIEVEQRQVGLGR